MKLVDEGASLVLYLRAGERDALSLEGTVDAAIRVDCRDDRPVLEIAVDDQAAGVRRTLTEGSNRQFSISIPPALATAVGLVDRELDADVVDGVLVVGPAK